MLKLLLFSIFAFAVLATCAQYPVRVSSEACGNRDVSAKHKLEFYKGDSLYLSVSPYASAIALRDTGFYTMSYRNEKKQRINQQVYISGTCPNYINMCFPDYSQKPDILLGIDRLENGDEYKLITYTQGCFVNRDDTVFLYRYGDRYFASWRDKHKWLEPCNVQTFRRFETELRSSGFRGGCTTLTSYTLWVMGPFFEKDIFWITDDSCDWNGLYRLLMDLFGSY